MQCTCNFQTHCVFTLFRLPCENIENWNCGEQKFTIKTDVWSFGVTLWEMFSADRPEKHLNKKNLKDAELVDELIKMYQEGKHKQQHQHLPKPLYCPPKVYAIMKQCWKFDDRTRPDFTNLFRMIADLTDTELD